MADGWDLSHVVTLACFPVGIVLMMTAAYAAMRDRPSVARNLCGIAAFAFLCAAVLSVTMHEWRNVAFTMPAIIAASVCTGVAEATRRADSS